MVSIPSRVRDYLQSPSEPLPLNMCPHGSITEVTTIADMPHAVIMCIRCGVIWQEVEAVWPYAGL